MRTLIGRVVVVMVLANVARASEPAIPAGKGEATVAIDRFRLQLFTYRPASYDAARGPLMLVFHGHSRNPDGYRDNAMKLADQAGAIVVAPFFDEKQFPGQSYNHGNVMKGDDVLPREQWTFSLIPKLIDELKRRERREEMPYYLLGHSGGGQFVERLMALGEMKPIRAVAANPGSHMFPTTDLPYPYGFGKLAPAVATEPAMKAYLAAPLTIYLGTADIDPNHAQLDRTEFAAAQGPFRLARGHKCFELGQQVATSHAWQFEWRVTEAPDVAHSAGKMFNHENARDALLGGSGKR